MCCFLTHFVDDVPLLDLAVLAGDGVRLHLAHHDAPLDGADHQAQVGRGQQLEGPTVRQIPAKAI